MNHLPAFILALSIAASAADKMTVTPDPDLPQLMDQALAQPLLDNSPFTRELNLSDSLTLTGIAHINGKTVATIYDKAKKGSYVVSEEPNAMGWKLAEANVATAISRSIVKIMVGNELVTVRYSAQQPALEDKKNSQSAERGGSNSDGGPPRREYHRSPEDEERHRMYESLSDKGKDKVREFFRENRDKMMNATPEERTAFIRQNFDRIHAEDSAGK